MKGSLKSIAIKWSWKSAHTPEGTSHWLLRRNICFWLLLQNPASIRSRWCDSSHENASHSIVISSQTVERSQCNPLWWIQNKQAPQPPHRYHWLLQIEGRHHEGTRTLHLVEVNQKWYLKSVYNFWLENECMCPVYVCLM